MSSVQVLPWIHAEDPINGSTIEVFAAWLHIALSSGVFRCRSLKGVREAWRKNDPKSRSRRIPKA